LGDLPRFAVFFPFFAGVRAAFFAPRFAIVPSSVAG
jgi:hypothetical protein